MEHPADDTPRCCGCGRNLWTDELTFVCCRLCLQRTDELLAELPGKDGLYARLSRLDALAPGSRRGDGPVSGSRTAPLPLRLEPLSLTSRGGVLTILQTWLADWFERLDWTHPRWRGGWQEQLDDTVHRLRVNLPWAMETHPAAAEFAAEVGAMVAACCAALDPASRPGRVVIGRCPVVTDDGVCGARLTASTAAEWVRCGTCGEAWPREEWPELRDAMDAVARDERSVA